VQEKLPYFNMVGGMPHVSFLSALVNGCGPAAGLDDAINVTIHATVPGDSVGQQASGDFRGFSLP
jgi:hypothetical protein